MRDKTGAINRRFLFLLLGFILGISAPVVWTIIRLTFFADFEISLWNQIFSDITASAYNVTLYCYMGIGTAMVMSFLGFFIGKATDQLHERAEELKTLHHEVANQKEIFENRYKALDSNIKNFNQISSRIHKSINLNEVLALCADGLHDILGYDRVNILMVNETKSNIYFVATTGSKEFNVANTFLPFDSRSGIIYKSLAERKVYLIDDITKYPDDFHLKPPFDNFQLLRSNSFVICPIVVKGESIGVFCIDNSMSHRALNDSDVDTVKLFADQAASSIIRINLLNAIDKLTVELGKTFTSLLQNRKLATRNVQRLKSSANSLADNTAHISSSAESVMESVDETGTAVNNISLAIEQVTQNLDSLSDATDKSVSAMVEINMSLKNVEQSTALSHSLSSQVKNQADLSRKVVEETINALSEIQHSVDLSYNGIKRLSKSSKRIEGIVTVINDITKRTNLLALNASIIAAQAGEYGKSFGVVADEIRNLSMQTGQSTGEITNIIEDIMNEYRLANSNVTVTKELAQKGVNLGQQTGESLIMIVDSALRAMEMTAQIKISTEEQGKGVQMVTDSIEGVSNMTSQIFNSSKEQANATKSIARAISSIKDMIHKMVCATGNQVLDSTEIKTSVDETGKMFIGIIDNIEHRRLESSMVVKELELMKEIAK